MLRAIHSRPQTNHRTGTARFSASRSSAPKICVLGSGRVGRAMVIDLATGNEFAVTAVDASSNSLAQLPTGVKTVKADLSQPAEVKKVVADADFVVGAVPGFMGFQTVQAVLESGKSIIDISFFPEDPFELDALAKSKKLTAIVDIGVAPGTDNLIIGRMEKELDRIDRFECLVGGLPVVRTWPYEYKAPFSPIDVLEEYTRPTRLVEHGQIVTRPALSEPELLNFAGIGTLEAFNTDGLRTLIKTFPKVPFMKEKTMRYPGHIELMRVLRETGFFCKDPVQVDGRTRVVPLELTSKLLFPKWQFAEGEEDLTIMRVVVEGRKGGKKVTHTFDLLDKYDRESKTTSMARTTGYTCTAAVRAFAKGIYRVPGISPPEFLGRDHATYDFVMAELAKRNIRFSHAQQ